MGFRPPLSSPSLPWPFPRDRPVLFCGILTMKKLGFHQKMGDLLGFDHEQLWISWDFMGFTVVG